MEYLKGWSDPCVTSMQLFCALCLPRLLVPPLLYWFPVCVCIFFFFLLVNYAHTQWVLNVLHPIIFGAGSVSWGVAQWHYISSFSKLFLCCLLLDTCVLGWNPQYLFGYWWKGQRLRLRFFFFFEKRISMAFMLFQWVPCTVHGTHKPLF